MKASAAMPSPHDRNVMRTRVRLRHSLLADAEIHTAMPATLEDFERALSRGGLEELKACMRAFDGD